MEVRPSPSIPVCKRLLNYMGNVKGTVHQLVGLTANGHLPLLVRS